MKHSITQLFGIKYPIIQGGMVWVSGHKLVSAVSNEGGLGLLGAGSMYPEVLRSHIKKCKKATNKPFGVNIPLKYPNIEQLMDIIIEEDVKIVVTSAGNPKIWTSILKEKKIKVAHVVSSVKFALKAESAGVDAIICEGFEAGGHNGINETTTFALIPAIQEKVNIPVIAAGGIASGKGVLAALALGADGVQIGSKFAATLESSAHKNFKQKIIELEDGDTFLTLKELGAVRLIKNNFFNQIEALYKQNPTTEELKTLLGRARIKKGIFEGDMENGELEIGQIASIIHDIKSVKQVFKELLFEYDEAKQELLNNSF